MSVLATRRAAPKPDTTNLVKRIMWALLIAQLALGTALVWVDFTGHQPGTVPITPRETTPVAPGDQVRRYDPTMVPSRDGQRRGRDGARKGTIALPETMRALSFRQITDERFGEVMVVEGGIAPGDGDRFVAALETALNGTAPPGTVSLHSPGGSLQDALVIARRIRGAALDTLVVADAACISACPTVLFAGTARYVARTAWIGMHQSYLADVTAVTTRRAVAEVQHIQGEVIAFAREAGVDAGVHALALQTPPEDVYFLVPDELEEYRVATELLD
ncbi:MAG: hypothetical protein AAF367_18635 [Pseudomonadota bacterium]